MDCNCVCGNSFHIDADFAYAVKCHVCGRVYEMSAMIEMRELQPGEIWDGEEPKEMNTDQIAIDKALDGLDG